MTTPNPIYSAEPRYAVRQDETLRQVYVMRREAPGVYRDVVEVLAGCGLSAREVADALNAHQNTEA